MDVCQTISQTDIKDKMAESNATNETEADMELRKTVEAFLNSTIDRVVELVDQRERELQETVDTFLNVTTDGVVELVNQRERERELQESETWLCSGILNNVANRVTDVWIETNNLIQAYRSQMGLCEENRNADLPNIANALSFTLPVTTAVVPGTLQLVKPIFSLQKGLSSMLPLTPLMVSEAGWLKPNNAMDMSPANNEDVCLPPMKDKTKKAKKFNLWRAKKMPVHGDSDDQQSNLATERKKHKEQRRQKKRDETSYSIADALKLTVPISTMLVPLATDSSTYDVPKTIGSVLPLTAHSVVSDNGTKIEATIADRALSTENIAMVEKLSGNEDKQPKITRWKKLRQFLKTLFKRYEGTKGTDIAVETVRGDDSTVVDSQKPEDHVTEDSGIELSDEKQSTDQKMSTRRKLRDVIRHLQCRC